jgi:hypothetical protein
MALNAAHNRFGETRAADETEERQTAKEDDRMRRAEEWVDRVAVRVGDATAFLGHELLRLGARVREEAEDIWAEAQNLRRGQRP